MSWANPTLADIANALTMSVSSDGQTAMSGPLNLGNNKIINQAAGVNASDGVNFGQVFNSPSFTGTPTAPTPSVTDNSTKIATTQYVQSALAGTFFPYEPSSNQSTPFNATYTYQLYTQQVVYSTAQATNDVVVNLIGNGTISLGTILPANNALAGVFGITNGPSAYKVTSWMIDGTAVSPKYVNGNAITTGNVNSFDVYNFSVLKDVSGDLLLLVNLTTYS